MITKKIKQKKGLQKNTVFSVVFLAIMLVLVSLLIVSNWKIGKKRAELNFQIEELKSKISELQERKEALMSQISNSADKNFLEKEAREVFNLKKPGEQVVTILPPQETEAEEKEPAQKNPWLIPLDIFGF